MFKQSLDADKLLFCQVITVLPSDQLFCQVINWADQCVLATQRPTRFYLIGFAGRPATEFRGRQASAEAFFSNSAASTEVTLEFSYLRQQTDFF